MRKLDENTDNSQLLKAFMDHYEARTPGINPNLIPPELINKLHEYNERDMIYAGGDAHWTLDQIKSWSTDDETAAAFSRKYPNGKVFEMPMKDFINTFNFISMDVLADYWVSDIVLKDIPITLVKVKYLYYQ